MRQLNFLVVGILCLLVFGISWVIRQGVSSSDWESFDLARVHFDALGAPTVDAPNWDRIIEAQGYVVASDRMFQMDLFRRASAGRLSEWFGEKAVEHDVSRREDDWQGTADRAAALLPADQKTYCDLYAKGVNRFIAEHPRHWGIEYTLLRQSPEPWTCRDSMLIIISMAADLTATSWNDWIDYRWRTVVDKEWFNFLLPETYPHNHPMFGNPETEVSHIPDKSHYLPPATRVQLQTAANTQRSEGAIGSNNWAYRGTAGFFIANDPHLANRVPQLWYAMRLRVSPTDWVVGAAIPGIPGIVLGMNPSIAWAFTNTGEDVDDLLIEEVDMTSGRYVANLKDGRENWAPLIRKPWQIQVKGKASITGETILTHRGPLHKKSWQGKELWMSRQWLGLIPEMIRMPSMRLASAKDWTEFNAAIDEMRIPSQNVLFMDRKGNMGYRNSGTGVLRKQPGRFPLPAIEGEWLGFEPYSQRRRQFIEANLAVPSNWLGTANERVWVDGNVSRWSPDDRKGRMTQVLAGRSDLTQADMTGLQRDTTSDYFKKTLNWLLAQADNIPPDQSTRWKKWDGNAASDEVAFTEATEAERIFMQTLLARVREHFKAPDETFLEYDSELKTGWVLELLESKEGVAPFGFDNRSFANAIVSYVSDKEKLGPIHPENNHWTVQHPFAKNIPLIGQIFAVDTPPMAGFRGVLRIERPKHSASMRLVWNMSDPAKSTWVFPVGQSGHPWTSHYKDGQKLWFGDKVANVFPEGETWQFSAK